jgi:carbon-monoxide dehydrogenase medium subunit
MATPAVLVDIGRISSLDYVKEDGDCIAVGSLTRHCDVAAAPLVRTEAPLLAEVAAQIGDPQVRHRGTIGGALAHGDPAADLPAVLLAMGGSVVVLGRAGRREIGADQLFKDFLETSLEPDEIIVEVRLPKSAGAGFAFEKFNRRAQDWAIVACAVMRGERTGVALVNMATTPVRAAAVEEALASGASDGEAAEAAAENLDVPEDLNASVEFRSHLARVLVRRALARAGGPSSRR